MNPYNLPANAPTAGRLFIIFMVDSPSVSLIYEFNLLHLIISTRKVSFMFDCRTTTPQRHFFARFIMVSVFLMIVGLVSRHAAADDQIGWITFDGPMLEQPSPFAWLVGESSSDTLLGMISKFDDVAEDEDLKGLVLYLKDFQVNSSQIFSLRRKVQQVRKAGKPVIVFAEVYGPGELLLGSAADKMLIQNGGFVSFPGLFTEEMYLADTLGLVGLKADYVQIGAYKGASEPMARNSPSPEWSQNMDGLLDDMWAQMTDALQTGRGFNNSQMKMVLDKAWAAEAEEAVAMGLIDGQLDAVDLKDYVKDQFDGASITTAIGNSGNDSQLDLENPFALFSMLMKVPDHTPKRDTIAVVHIDGTIIDGESTTGGMFGGASVGDRTIRKALKTVEDDDMIKGLVLRINSPGGSALASEMIWQGVRRVAAKKPVYVSVGSMAASGGYYISVSGDKIFVDPMSIVGSIGVVGGKIAWGGLYDKFKVGITTRARGPHANLNSSVEPWNEEERGLIRQMMKKTYNLFTKRVTQGRKGKANLSNVAEGRIFTGRQAVENGLADGIADFDVVISKMASETGLMEGQYDVMTYPGPMSFQDLIRQAIPFASAMAPVSGNAPDQSGMMSGIAQQAAASVLREMVGPKNWPQLRDALNGFLLMRQERVLLISPRVVLFN